MNDTDKTTTKGLRARTAAAPRERLMSVPEHLEPAVEAMISGGTPARQALMWALYHHTGKLIQIAKTKRAVLEGYTYQAGLGNVRACKVLVTVQEAHANV